MTKPRLIGLAALLAIGIASAAVFVPTEAQAGGGRSLESWWIAQAMLAVASAVVVRSLASGKGALLAATFLVGSAGQLALTSPLWLQYVEMRPDVLRAGVRPLGVLAVAVQLGAVAVALRGRVRTLLASARTLIGPRLAIAAGLALVFAGAHVSVFIDGFPDPYFVAGYAAQLAAVAGFVVVNVVHLWLFARSLPEDALGRAVTWLRTRISFPGAGAGDRTLDRRVPWALAALAFVVSVLVATLVFERMPHVQDEHAFFFQARQFASLAVSSPAPPEFEAHAYYLIDVCDGRWYAVTKPGWPAVLALGVLLGVPWLVNPLLGAAGVLLLHRLVARLTGDTGTAHVAAALAATSPWYLFLAGSMMGHTLPLLVTLVGFLLVERAMRESAVLPAALAGLTFGFGVLIRPLDGLVVGGLAALWVLVEKGFRWKILLPYGAGSVAGTLPMLAYNRALVGGALVDPIQRYLDRIWFVGANRLGFGDDIGPPGGWGTLDWRPGHDMFEVLINANQNVYNINFELLGWAYISLVPIVAHLAWCRWSALDRRLAVFTITLPAVLSIYWFSGGPDFGARYWFLLFIPLIVWSALGLRTITARLARGSEDSLVGARVAAAVALLAVVSLGVFCSWRSVARYVEYRDVHADYRELIAAEDLGNALVVVEATSRSEIEAALLVNHPTLPADQPVFVHVESPEDVARLRAAYPGRPVVRVRGRSGPGTSVEIVERLR